MTAQEQAKVLQQSLLSQQSVKKLLDAKWVSVDGPATGTGDVVLTTLDILQGTPDRRSGILPPALDMGDPRSYITNVREPGPMPNVGWGG